MINIDKPLLGLYNTYKERAIMQGRPFLEYDEWREELRERAKEKTDE